MSLRPVAVRLRELLGRDGRVRRGLHRPASRARRREPPAGGVVLLENLRFHPEEEKNDAGFAKGLAALATST